MKEVRQKGRIYAKSRSNLRPDGKGKALLSELKIDETKLVLLNVLQSVFMLICSRGFSENKEDRKIVR